MIKRYLKKVQQLQLSALGTKVIITISNYFDEVDGVWFYVYLKYGDFACHGMSFVYDPDMGKRSEVKAFDAKIAEIEEFIKKYGSDDRS